MENIKNENVEVKVDSKKVKNTESLDKTSEMIKSKLDDELLLIKDDNFTNNIAFKKLSELTEDDLSYFGKGVLKCVVVKAKNGSYIKMALKLGDNVVLQDSLTKEKSVILNKLRPELINNETIIPVKLISFIPISSVKENVHTGEIVSSRAYCCIAPICESVVFNGGLKENRFTHKKTSKSYLSKDKITLIKIHNNDNPDKLVRFYDLGEQGNIDSDEEYDLSFSE